MDDTTAIAVYHGSSEAEPWVGAGLFLTPDDLVAEAYAEDASRPGERDGYVHTFELTGPLIDADHVNHLAAELHIEIEEELTVMGLYDPSLLEAASQAGYVGIIILETHPSSVTAPTVVVADTGALTYIETHRIEPYDEEGEHG